MPEYEVYLYDSTVRRYIIAADNEDDAIDLAEDRWYEGDNGTLVRAEITDREAEEIEAV